MRTQLSSCLAICGLVLCAAPLVYGTRLQQQRPVTVAQRRVSKPLTNLIRRLPKAELHVHVEGTLEPELMFKLAERNNITLPYPDVAAAKAARSKFTNLQSFLDAYHVSETVLLKRQDFKDLAAAYFEEAAANNITHVELFFDPQSHMARGVTFGDVYDGLQAAITARRTHPSHPIDATLVICFDRQLGQLAAAKALAAALPYIGGISALGMGGAEVGHPPENYRDVYSTGGLLGLHKVAHAGEEGGPEYVWGAIRALHVQRIDHGIRSLEDPQLVRYMADTRLPITLCPLSNLHLQVYAGSLEEKLRAILASGIIVTINSDDPAYFSGYLNTNYEYLAAVADLGAGDITRLVRNSFAASFISGEQKLQAYAQIREVLAAWTQEQQDDHVAVS
ncbi:adenosine deaminase [Scenedesmus sp. NREL 46B-D3]|nr:adenosine deaminase [Scenedesmus sp. NREL 46B-D3]